MGKVNDLLDDVKAVFAIGQAALGAVGATIETIQRAISQNRDPTDAEMEASNARRARAESDWASLAPTATPTPPADTVPGEGQ
jgi:hypothetical protein